MTGPIDQSAFDHHEKTVLFILTQKIDRSLCNLFKWQIPRFPVDGIRQTPHVTSLLLHKNNFICFRCFFPEIVISPGYRIPRPIEKSINIYGIFFLRLYKTGSGIKIETRFRQIGCDLIGHIPVRLMSIETSGSSMIDTIVGSDPYFHSQFFGFGSDTVYRCFMFFIHRYRPVLCLFAGS